MDCQLEHANITVQNMDRAIEFLTTAFPHFKVRGGGESDHGTWHKRWCHLGTDWLYVALEQTTIASKTERRPAEETGINHVGFTVESIEDIRQNMEAAGYKNSVADERPYRQRLYVTDADGITWEFVEYYSDDPAERNHYES